MSDSDFESQEVIVLSDDEQVPPLQQLQPVLTWHAANPNGHLHSIPTLLPTFSSENYADSVDSIHHNFQLGQAHRRAHAQQTVFFVGSEQEIGLWQRDISADEARDGCATEVAALLLAQGRQWTSKMEIDIRTMRVQYIDERGQLHNLCTRMKSKTSPSIQYGNGGRMNKHAHCVLLFEKHLLPPGTLYPLI